MTGNKWYFKSMLVSTLSARFWVQSFQQERHKVSQKDTWIKASVIKSTYSQIRYWLNNHLCITPSGRLIIFHCWYKQTFTHGYPLTKNRQCPNRLSSKQAYFSPGSRRRKGNTYITHISPTKTETTTGSEAPPWKQRAGTRSGQRQDTAGGWHLTHFSSSSFFFMMSLLQAGMLASRAVSSSTWESHRKTGCSLLHTLTHSKSEHKMFSHVLSWENK